jgi:hypothetical protein
MLPSFQNSLTLSPCSLWITTAVMFSRLGDWTLKADVALHYLIYFSQDRLTEAVNLGAQRAREWCKQMVFRRTHWVLTTRRTSED